MSREARRLLKNSRRSRCLRHGRGCKASRRRRCLCTSSRSDNTAGGVVPRQPKGPIREWPRGRARGAGRAGQGGRPQEWWCPFKGGQHRHAKPAARAQRDGASRAPGFVTSFIRWHRIGPRSFSRHASRLASVAAPFHPRIGPRAQGIGGHLHCCGSYKGPPPCRRRRASHMALQASCARPTRVSQPPAKPLTLSQSVSLCTGERGVGILPEKDT